MELCILIGKLHLSRIPVHTTDPPSSIRRTNEMSAILGPTKKWEVKPPKRLSYAFLCYRQDAHLRDCKFVHFDKGTSIASLVQKVSDKLGVSGVKEVRLTKNLETVTILMDDTDCNWDWAAWIENYGQRTGLAMLVV